MYFCVSKLNKLAACQGSSARWYVYPHAGATPQRPPGRSLPRARSGSYRSGRQPWQLPSSAWRRSLAGWRPTSSCLLPLQTPLRGRQPAPALAPLRVASWRGALRACGAATKGSHCNIPACLGLASRLAAAASRRCPAGWPARSSRRRHLRNARRSNSRGRHQAAAPSAQRTPAAPLQHPPARCCAPAAWTMCRSLASSSSRRHPTRRPPPRQAAVQWQQCAVTALPLWMARPTGRPAWQQR